MTVIEKIHKKPNHSGKRLDIKCASSKCNNDRDQEIARYDFYILTIEILNKGKKDKSKIKNIKVVSNISIKHIYL